MTEHERKQEIVRKIQERIASYPSEKLEELERELSMRTYLQPRQPQQSRACLYEHPEGGEPIAEFPIPPVISYRKKLLRELYTNGVTILQNYIDLDAESSDVRIQRWIIEELRAILIKVKEEFKHELGF